MGTPVMAIDSTVMCGHGGSAKIIPSAVRVTLGGVPVAVQTDVTMVAGCPFTVPPGTPMPCVPVQWMTGALRVTAMGKPVLLMSSKGMNTGLGPPVPVSVVKTQTRVSAT